MSKRHNTNLRLTAALLLVVAVIAQAQTVPAPATPAVPAAKANDAPPTPTDNIRYGYVIHQSVTLGGHMVEKSGSGAMYDTLVNLQSGPRFLDGSLDLRAVDVSKAKLFDHLSTYNFGYGGDPNSVSTLNMTKGKAYDLRGNYRRDRQYFDNDLLANPLIPPTSTVYVPVLDSPHLYNTVREMTDLGLTIAPLAKVTGRVGFNHSVSHGPSFSTVHQGTEGLLSQYFRNATNSYSVGLDWKPLKQTSVSYDEFLTAYKEDTTWKLTGLNYVLTNGTPVSGGIDISSVWATPCAAPFVSPGVYLATCTGYTGYTRLAPVRTLFPTEQIRFQSGSIPKFTFNGRLLYNATTSNLNNYSENFTGFASKAVATVGTGAARVRRIDVNGDFSAAWQVTKTITATNVFDFGDFRMPGTNGFTTTTYAGTSMLLPSTSNTTASTTDFQWINQKTKTDTFNVAWDAPRMSRFSVGYRYRSRIITDAGGDFIPIHEQWGLFGMTLKPTPQWRLNGNVEAMYADMSFTRISPRQMQHYIVRSVYKPVTWVSLTGTLNVRESRDNVSTVNHLEHNRDFSGGVSISPNERWSVDAYYAYDDVFSSTIECYASTPAPPSATAAPAVCVTASTPYASTGYYNAPTQVGSVSLMLVPVKRLHFNGGYRLTAVNGTTDNINIRQVPGSLQSQFHTPYANVAFDLAPNWQWKADYNYFGYGEDGPVGPTAPRSFHGNITTLAVHYSF